MTSPRSLQRRGPHRAVRFSTFTTNTTAPAACDPGTEARRVPGLQYGQSRAVDGIHDAQLRGVCTRLLRPRRTRGRHGHSTATRGCGSRTPTDGFCREAAPCTMASSRSSTRTERGARSRLGSARETTGLHGLCRSRAGLRWRHHIRVPTRARRPGFDCHHRCRCGHGDGRSVRSRSTRRSWRRSARRSSRSRSAGRAQRRRRPSTVPAGQTATQSFTLPFGTTSVTVQAQGVTIASAPVTFQPPARAGTANSAQEGSELREPDPSGHAGVAMALVLIGFGLGAIGLAQVLPRRRTRDA